MRKSTKHTLFSLLLALTLICTSLGTTATVSAKSIDGEYTLSYGDTGYADVNLRSATSFKVRVNVEYGDVIVKIHRSGWESQSFYYSEGDDRTITTTGCDPSRDYYVSFTGNPRCRISYTISF